MVPPEKVRDPTCDDVPLRCAQSSRLRGIHGRAGDFLQGQWFGRPPWLGVRDGTLLVRRRTFSGARADKSARGDLTRLLDRAPGGPPSPEDVI
ncbi:MAG: hypothetical protein AAAB35_12690 [Phyllobacterium sp.]|uniref:hypothetical protein n=1 Tax=Phyllobacterium sp. TaxID=1871046 RepID=UPI0030F2792F